MKKKHTIYFLYIFSAIFILSCQKRHANQSAFMEEEEKISGMTYDTLLLLNPETGREELNVIENRATLVFGKK